LRQRSTPWDRHGQPRTAALIYVGLRGAAVYRMTADPANDRNVVAATIRGLHHTTSGLAPDPWALVTAFDTAMGGNSSTTPVTDVAWTPATGARGSRVWVAVVSTATPALTGVWVSSNGLAGPFTQVSLPGLGTPARLCFATQPAFPDVVYVLASGPNLWRIDNVTP